MEVKCQLAYPFSATAADKPCLKTHLPQNVWFVNGVPPDATEVSDVYSFICKRKAIFEA